MLLEKFENILNNIIRYVPLKVEEKEAFCDIIEIKKVKKRQYIVQPGFVCQHQTYVEKGALRSYFISPDGNDHTIQFAVEDWFISDFTSYINQEAASIYVEALENSEIQQIEYHKVENLCDNFPVFEKYFRLVSQKAFAFSQKRVLSNLGESAESRYDNFLSRYPNIVNRVPQYTLASYLGMTPEFLSKIRRRKMEKA